MSKRIVITGLGAVTPLGNDVPTFWDGLINGRSGIGQITQFDASEYGATIAGEVKDADFSSIADAKEIGRTDRYILLGMLAAAEAIKDSGLDLEAINKERAGTIVSAGIGGLRYFEDQAEILFNKGPKRVSPFLIPMIIADMAAGMIAMKFGLKGPNYAVVSACASATHSIGDAYVNLKAGMMDVCLAGGCEASITRVGISGFAKMKALSMTNNDTPERASRPFDKDRNGFVMGEGSGVVVLETLEHALARNAPIYGEVVGYGATCDAFHLSQPAPEGEGAQRSMKMAVDSAGMKLTDLDYINAHGTSTPFNDKNESTAIIKVFGDHAYDLSVSSTKSMTGHLLGASGGVEFVASTLAVKNDLIPPTINYETPDPECPLDYTPNESRRRTVNYAMSNSFGFGGHNASVIIKKYEATE